VALWFTSDTHFGHANIIKYCNRPFYNTDHMNAALVDQYNDNVDDGDDVWWLGDIALGNTETSLLHVRSCKGHKTLVVGNHDRMFHTARSRRPPDPRWEQIYRDAGFERVITTHTSLTLSEGTAVNISHFPYSGDHSSTDRYSEARPHDDGRWLLCGHVHDAWTQQQRQINVGVDAWAGFPVNETVICSLIDGGPAHRPPSPWSWNQDTRPGPEEPTHTISIP